MWFIFYQSEEDVCCLSTEVRRHIPDNRKVVWRTAVTWCRAHCERAVADTLVQPRRLIALLFPANESPCMPDVINRIARRVVQEWQRLHFDVKAIQSFPDVTPLALPYKDAWTRMYSPPSPLSSTSTFTRQLKYPSFARDFIKINRRDRITHLIVK